MKSLILRAAMLALAISLPVSGQAARPAAKSAHATTDWLATGHRTAEGAIVIGNPKAKVRLVEYISMTCPHCAALSAEEMPALRKDYVGKGLVSLEVRHAVRDGYDFVASLLLRCEAPAQYLSSIEALFATQDDWMKKAESAKQNPDFPLMTDEEKMTYVANMAGFKDFFAQRGMDAKAFAACLADKKEQDQLVKMAGNSWDRDHIPGTPLILVNGVRHEHVHTWAELEPLIKAALK